MLKVGFFGIVNFGSTVVCEVWTWSVNSGWYHDQYCGIDNDGFYESVTGQKLTSHDVWLELTSKSECKVATNNFTFFTELNLMSPVTHHTTGNSTIIVVHLLQLSSM